MCLVWYLTRVSLTLYYNRRNFYYQPYTHILTLFSKLCNRMNLVLYLLSVIFEPTSYILPEFGFIHVIYANKRNTLLIPDKIKKNKRDIQGN